MAPGRKSAKADGKKAKPKGGIKMASAAKVMKGALPEKHRLSVNAVAVAVRETEMCLARIAKECQAALGYAKRKTLNHTYLLEVLEKMCIHPDLLRAARTARVSDKIKGDRNLIANASVGRVIKKQLGKDYRLSATVLDAFSLIAAADLRRFALSAAAVIKVSGRTTIKERDIIAVVQISGH